LPIGSHITAERTALLEAINAEKKRTAGLINRAVEGAWVGYANAMGLVCKEGLSTSDQRKITNMDDVRKSLRQLDLKERMEALYFLTGYVRDVIHGHVMWGETHQTIVEDYVMQTMDATFAISRDEMTAGHKTCVGQLYGQVYNRKKQKLYAAVLPKHTTLSVDSKEFKTKSSWKRPKTQYFVHTHMIEMDTGTSRVVSKLVITSSHLLYMTIQIIRLTTHILIQLIQYRWIYERQLVILLGNLASNSSYTNF
jgi:hypothetical protein